MTNETILSQTGIPTPVQTGYTFEGWAYDEAGTQPVGVDDLITVDLTVYAVWEVE